MSQVVEVAQTEVRHHADGAQAERLKPFELQHHTQGLRTEPLAQAVGAPWRWLRSRVERLRTPIDFEPLF